MAFDFHSWASWYIELESGRMFPRNNAPRRRTGRASRTCDEELSRTHVSLDDDLVVAGGLHSLGAAILVPGFVPAPNLKAAFEKHRNQTKGHVERLQQVFETMGKRPQGKTCEAIQGIIAEGEEIMEEFKDMPAFDAGLISSAQRSRAIWMMIGIGTPSSHRRIERISCSFASVEIP